MPSKNQILAKISYIAGFFPLTAIFALAIFVSHIEIRDYDLWLHIASGRYIVNHHFLIPAHDFLSCTIAGKTWINHEWLFQVLVYSLFNKFGTQGLLKMQTVVVFCTLCVLLSLGEMKQKQLGTIFLLLLTFLVYQQRFTIRPDLFSLLFFALYIFFLALHIDKRWSLYALFVIQILWVNVHGFFFFGPLFVFIGLFSEWIKRHLPLPYSWNESGRLTDEEYGRLKKIFLFVSLACLVNPYFIEGALYPVNIFKSLAGDSRIFFKYIIELQNPVSLANIFDDKYVYYKILILISFVSFVFNRRNLDISALLLWAVFLVFSLKAVRNVAFFAFAAYLVTITNFLGFSVRDVIPLRFNEEKFRHITSIWFKLIIFLWIMVYFQSISVTGYYDFDRYQKKSIFGGISLKSYPSKAVDFLIANQIKGNFFNDFNSGAYLLGRCYPDIKVFIDGRTEVYGGEFFKNYLKIWEGGDGKLFDEVAQRYNLTGALLNSAEQTIPEKILQYLYEKDGWIPVYFDYDAVIFLKNVPENKNVIDQYKIDFDRLPLKVVDLDKIGIERVKPSPSIDRGFTLNSLGFYDQALKEVDMALRIEPSYSGIYGLLGKIYAGKKEGEKAFENFRIAAVHDPSQQNLHNLALSLMDLKKYDLAVAQYQDILKRWPSDLRALFSLSLCYAKAGQYQRALDVLDGIKPFNSRMFMDVMTVADAIFDNQAYDKALEVYQLAMGIDAENSLVHKKMALVYDKMNDYQEALKEAEKGLTFDPKDEELKNLFKDLQRKILKK